MRTSKASGLAEVAKLAGVSTATVSNALNRPEVVAGPTRERVLAAIRKLEFVPSSAAAALRQGTSRIIGLVLPDITNPFYSAITSAVTDAADESGFGIALCVSHDDPARELRHFELLAQQRAPGALVIPVRADPSRLAKLRSVGTRLILVDRVADPEEGCSVVMDDVHGGEMAMGHLLRTRGARLVLVNGRRSIPQCADRREGARRALAASGRNLDDLVELDVDDMTIESGVAIGRHLAELEPSGVFCTNDLLATGVVRGLLQAGRLVPEEFAVVGYGDLELATQGVMPLTTVEQPKEDLGRTALVRLLDEMRGSDHEHSVTVFEPALVVRDSAPL